MSSDDGIMNEYVWAMMRREESVCVFVFLGGMLCHVFLDGSPVCIDI